jgi:MFS family permease
VSKVQSGTGRWAALLRTPGVRPFVVASLLARLPLSMLQLGVVLLVRDEGHSYAVAGATVACYTIALAVAQPMLGRVVDRVGQRRVLIPLALAFPTAVGAVVAGAVAGIPAGLLLPLAVVMGATLPPIEPCVRAAWPSLAPTPSLRATAYAMEATLRELVFIGGPLVVALVASLVSAAAAMLLTAAIGLGGTLAFVSTHAVRGWHPHPHTGHRSRLGALVAPGVRTVIGASVAMGIAFGTIAVSMPAFGEDHGSRSDGGLCLATFAAGSLVGGLIAGALPHAIWPARRYVLSLALFAVGLVPMIIAWSIPAMLVATLIGGLAIAPSFATAYGLVDDLAPPSTVTEAFAWMSTSLTGGYGLGTAVAGLAITGGGVTLALGVALAAAAAAAAVAALRRATLAARAPRSAVT